MSAIRERWMLFGTFVLAVIVMFCFAWPNYREAKINEDEALRLENRINRLERRQVEVQKMRESYESLEQQVHAEYKDVPTSPDTAKIVQELSYEVDGVHVLDQSFVAGSTLGKNTEGNKECFSVQPLAITMEADFDSIFSVIRKAESMKRLIRVSSVRIKRSERDADNATSTLDAAIGLHAPYEPMEDR